MRVNIFDNGLQAKTGHHFDFCLRLGAGLRARGHTVQVYGTALCDPAVALALAQKDCGFTALFSHFAYAPLELSASAPAELEQLARIAAGELARAAPADLNIFPSLKPLEFHAFALSGLTGKGIGYAHAEPSQQGVLAGQVWHLASQELRRHGGNFRIGAIDPVIAEFLASFLDGMPVDTFPIALDGPSRNGYADTPTTIGFFGSQREERGMDVIVPLAEQLLTLGYKVVLHDTNGRFTNQAGNPNLRVLDRFIDDLQAEMAACDIVVCPMRRENYAHRMSGIVCNAISCGIPVVLPAGTLAAARFRELGSLVCYMQHSVAGILLAVQELERHYAHHADMARQAALQWRATHGVEHFIDKVIESVN